MCLPTLMIESNGLALHYRTHASPIRYYDYWSTSSPRSSWFTSGRRTTKYSEPVSNRSGRRSTQNVVSVERMAQSGSYTDNKSVEKQDGKWDQETIRQRRGLHHVGSADRFGDCRNRLLAVRQLLVAGAGGRCCDDRLTEGRQRRRDTSAGSGDQRRRGVRVGGRGRRIARGIRNGESRKQLASGRDVRYGFTESLTSRHV